MNTTKQVRVNLLEIGDMVSMGWGRNPARVKIIKPVTGAVNGTEYEITLESGVFMICTPGCRFDILEPVQPGQ